MSDQEEDYVYDEASGEWMSASEARDRAATADTATNVVDSNGTPLQDGDSVTLIKDLKVKGAGQTLKRGLVVKNIRLTANPEEVDCRTDGIKGLVLRTEFLKKH
ncbi:alkylphosphonate utilization protein [Aquisediminimonas sediminicola]|uniref:alkylphosphonate utilization protein n=1 Tax=Alteraquisediminimonas sediminicola TaxID=2676787 RepID=UPI001C8DBD41|nr:alkylphosphonate utilization protein [Aquisediminimonas sediminicola]